MNRLMNYFNPLDSGRWIVLALLNMIFISDLSLYAMFKTGNGMYLLPLCLSTAGAVYAGVNIPEPRVSSDHSTHYHLVIISDENQLVDRPGDLPRRW